MAIYHLHVKNISRGDGRSAVAAAAYRAGQVLPNAAEEGASNFGGRRDILHSEILLPADAPAWMADRGQLWNAAEAAERRKDARLAKEVEFALPRELAPAMWLSVARAMAAVYTAAGHVVDLAIHEDGTAHNPHVHLLLTTRRIEKGGFGGKLREADGLKFVTEARASWAQIANAALAAAGAGVEIEPRSHNISGVGLRPGRHRGPNTFEREARRAQRDQVGSDVMRELQDQLRAADLNDPERYPVPDPDGRPTSPVEQNKAEEAMIEEMERPVDDQVAHPDQATAEMPAVKLSEEDWWREKADVADEQPVRDPIARTDRQWWDDPEQTATPDQQEEGDGLWERGRA